MPKSFVIKSADSSTTLKFSLAGMDYFTVALEESGSMLKQRFGVIPTHMDWLVYFKKWQTSGAAGMTRWTGGLPKAILQYRQFQMVEGILT